MPVNYAIKSTLTGLFLGRGNSPGGFQDNSVINDCHLYEHFQDVIDHIDWIFEWAKFPTSGPRIVLTKGETFAIIKVEFTYHLSTQGVYSGCPIKGRYSSYDQ